MLIKKRRERLQSQVSSKTQELFHRGKTALQIDQQQEFAEIQKQLQSLTPSTQLSLQTLVKNSKLESEISLPERDALLAEITAYSYLTPEQRPYQV